MARVGFDQFHQDAAGVLRVDEVDARVGRTASGGSVVQQPNPPAVAKLGGDGVDVGDPVGELLESGAASVDELGDGRILVQRREQLNGSGSGGGEPTTESMASRTPCDSLISSWVDTMPRCCVYHAIATSRSGTAIPT